MRVLQVMASGARGGGANHLLGLMPELAALGFACEAAVGDDGPLGEELQRLGFVVHPIDLMGSRGDWRRARELAHLIRRIDPDIVHCHGTRAAYYRAMASPWLRGLGAQRFRSIYTAHGLAYRKEERGLLAGPRRRVFRWAEAVACRAADEVISVSAADLRDLQRRGYIAAGSGVHVPNAVDTVRVRPRSRRAARRLLGWPQDAFVVGTVSRLVPQKSLHDLVRALALLPCDDARSALQCVIVGDGPLRDPLMALAQQLGVASHVRFVGARDDVPTLLAAFDLFVLCSRWEGEPIALLEAMAAGLPCVATATEGAQEIIEPGETGLLVKVGNANALAHALQGLRVDAERCAALGRRARAAMLQRTPAAQAQRIAAVYERCVERASAH